MGTSHTMSASGEKQSGAGGSDLGCHAPRRKAARATRYRSGGRLKTTEDASARFRQVPHCHTPRADTPCAGGLAARRRLLGWWLPWLLFMVVPAVRCGLAKQRRTRTHGQVCGGTPPAHAALAALAAAAPSPSPPQLRPRTADMSTVLREYSSRQHRRLGRI